VEALRAAGKQPELITVPAGEASKSLITAQTVCGAMARAGLDRKSFVVALGGGVIGDLGGFCASIYQRGIPYLQVPTTVLSQVDSSVGGKTGVNLPEAKNMVGNFHQPAHVIADVGTLATLHPREWNEGFAEIIKHACILDRSSFKTLQQRDTTKWRKDSKALAQLIERNARLKSKVVQQDEFETGNRKLLNFGHTLGHAFETQYGLSHGQAIAIGMTCAGMFSEDILGFRGHEELRALLEQYGLPTFLRFDAEKVLGLLRMDKKRAGKDIHFILLERIGKGVVKGIPIRELEARVSRIALIN
jgi:3-dehydroquinate synthase